MLDEIALRLPGWTEGVAFTLADGQSWHFPEPLLENFPKVIDGEIDLGLATSFGPEFDDLVGQLGAAETTADQLVLAFKLAFIMLRRNYALSDDDLATLLRFRVREGHGREESIDLFSSIIDVATGYSKKAPPVG